MLRDTHSLLKRRELPRSTLNGSTIEVGDSSVHVRNLLLSRSAAEAVAPPRGN